MFATEDPMIADYHQGGMMTAVGGWHLGRVVDAKEDSDGLGRWSWICLEGQRTNLYVVTAYCVQQEDSDETSTACTQKKKLL
eukprot:8929091-Ditylum_brightwellii.AAC.1